MTIGNFKALMIGSMVAIPVQLLTTGFSYSWLWTALCVGMFIGARFVKK